MVNKGLRCLRKVNTLNADFESILVPEDNGTENPEESYMCKYQKHVACRYGYQLACVDVNISKPFKSCLGCL